MNLAIGQVMQEKKPSFEAFARAYALLQIEADFKHVAEDFRVEEVLPFELGGEGEHVWLHIQKTGCNTEWVARQLARVAGLKPRAIGYAGLKDRHGITCQWFSVQLPGKAAPDWTGLESSEIHILQSIRHRRKLNRGALKQNRFVIRLRNLQGDDVDALESRCQLIATEGVPNYFGEQRFGHGLSNIKAAQHMFEHPHKKLPRHQRSLYLSAARSWLFNTILSQRIKLKNWNRRLEGDAFMLEGSHACFRDDASPELCDRLEQAEIHPTAVLWGSGESLVSGQCAELEAAIINDHSVLGQGLIAADVQQQRRALRVVPGELELQREAADAVLTFSLPAGTYATAVLREMLTLKERKADFVG